MATDWASRLVVDLRAELKRRGLPQTGKKVDMVKRLTEDDDANSSAVPPDDATSRDACDNGKQPNPNPAEDTKAPATTLSPTEKVTNKGQAQDAPEQVPSIDDDEKKPTFEEPTSKDATKPAIADSEPSTEAVAPGTEEEPESTEVPTPSLAPTQVPAEANAALTGAMEVDEAPVKDPNPAASDIINDAQSRKRRSRSPTVQSEEASRKRLRIDSDQNEHGGRATIDGTPSEDAIETTQSSATAIEEVPAPLVSETSSTEAPEQTPVTTDAQKDGGDVVMPSARADDTQEKVAQTEELESEQTQIAPTHDAEEPRALDSDIDMVNVAPALYHATHALYIKNFMRPLKDNELKAHIADLATPPGADPDPSIVTDFFIDHLKTHAFVQFTSVSAAARVRIALHGKVYPDEKNRKELWADFIPPDKMEAWVEQERSVGGGRSNPRRWEVLYESDEEGAMTATLVEASSGPAKRGPKPPSGPSHASTPQIPTGPSNFTGIEGAPKGPRGGNNFVAHRDIDGEAQKATRATPSITYSPVAPELAKERLDNMRSYYAKDCKRRDMGREDEINRYTFENRATFVDRGKENFVGIRPPHRERERRRAPNAPHLPHGSDRYIGGGGGGGGRGARSPPPSRRDDGPRSRLDGQPLPSYSDYRSDRRGGGGRNDYRGSRY